MACASTGSRGCSRARESRSAAHSQELRLQRHGLEGVAIEPGVLDEVPFLERQVLREEFEQFEVGLVPRIDRDQAGVADLIGEEVRDERPTANVHLEDAPTFARREQDAAATEHGLHDDAADEGVVAGTEQLAEESVMRRELSTGGAIDPVGDADASEFVERYGGGSPESHRGAISWMAP